MKYAARLAFWFWVGYTVTTRLAPAIQAKVEAHDIDAMWVIANEQMEWGNE